tara:strand:- start:3828 stop:4130 length:303 start_codon:yes stop_codon:yes gene_type:complete
MSMPRWALWFVMQFSFIVMICALMMMPFIVWGDLGSSEETWTDFSPKTINDPDPGNMIAKANQAIQLIEVEKDIQADLDKEKYRVYFEDKNLVLNGAWWS